MSFLVQVLMDSANEVVRLFAKMTNNQPVPEVEKPKPKKTNFCQKIANQAKKVAKKVVSTVSWKPGKKNKKEEKGKNNTNYVLFKIEKVKHKETVNNDNFWQAIIVGCCIIAAAIIFKNGCCITAAAIISKMS